MWTLSVILSFICLFLMGFDEINRLFLIVILENVTHPFLIIYLYYNIIDLIRSQIIVIALLNNHLLSSHLSSL